jgi:hypothetical protein
VVIVDVDVVGDVTVDVVVFVVVDVTVAVVAEVTVEVLTEVTVLVVVVVEGGDVLVDEDVVVPDVLVLGQSTVPEGKEAVLPPMMISSRPKAGFWTFPCTPHTALVL